MDKINSFRDKIDAWQRKHPVVSFPYAVIKKYGEDESGNQAALLTYYAFLALFPLLLVLTTITGIVAGSNEDLQNTVLKALNEYFPVFANQLSEKIGGLHKGGIALVIGILFSLYGARGVADAFRTGINKIWHVPRVKRDGFPISFIKSMGIIIVGGAGFLTAAIVSGFVATGAGVGFQALSIALNLIILVALFNFLLKTSLPGRVTFRDTKAGAISAAVGIIILQIVGSAILKHQLKNLDALYSTFAIPLGLLFWLYLQAQVLYYSIQIAAVRSQKLWPRGMDSKKPTAADTRAYTKMPASQQYLPNQKITSRFHKRK